MQNTAVFKERERERETKGSSEDTELFETAVAQFSREIFDISLYNFQ